MKEKKNSMDMLRELCGEVHSDDGMDFRLLKKEKRPKNNLVRDRQLCAQVKRCLDIAVIETLARFGVSTCEVCSVEPAPDTARLAVVVAVSADHLESVRELLPKFKGALRNEVAQTIHRKKAPDLAFSVIAHSESFEEYEEYDD